MSPPQVNLAVKESPAVGYEELKSEKNDPLAFPAVVTIDTERIHVQRAIHQQQRRRRIICCSALVVLVGLACLAVLPLALKWHMHHRNRFSCHFGKNRISENVSVDNKLKLIYARHGHGSVQEPPIHVLHEYGRRMAAYKDEDQKICYITRLDETFEEGYKRWEKYEKNDSRAPKTLRVLTDKQIAAVVVEHIADIHIHAHCENTESYWAVEIEEISVTTEMKIIHV